MMPPISVSEPLSRAWERMMLVLFRPFDLGKWFAIGLGAFLANLGEGGGNFNFPSGGGGGGGGGGGPRGGPGVWDWLTSNLAVVLLIALLAAVAIIGITVLVTWLRARGTFMFMHALALNSREVRRPWNEYGREANSLFVARLVLTGITWAAFLLVGVLLLVIALPDIRAETFGAPAVIAIILGVLLLLPIGIASAIAALLMDDFAAPVMFTQRVAFRPAAAIAWREAVRRQPGPVVLFYLMRIALGMGAGMILVAATCATCCIAGLPYIGTVITLPVFAFLRSYTLYFVAQFGPAFDTLRLARDLTCTACGYDLRGNPAATRCPECGRPIGGEEPPAIMLEEAGPGEG